DHRPPCESFETLPNPKNDLRPGNIPPKPAFEKIPPVAGAAPMPAPPPDEDGTNGGVPPTVAPGKSTFPPAPKMGGKMDPSPPPLPAPPPVPPDGRNGGVPPGAPPANTGTAPIPRMPPSPPNIPPPPPLPPPIPPCCICAFAPGTNRFISIAATREVTTSLMAVSSAVFREFPMADHTDCDLVTRASNTPPACCFSDWKMLWYWSVTSLRVDVAPLICATSISVVVAFWSDSFSCWPNSRILLPIWSR